MEETKTVHFTLEQQIAELKREISLRKNCYPKWIGARLTQAQADLQLGAMQAALGSLECLKVLRDTAIFRPST